jgi:hypothetical protein
VQLADSSGLTEAAKATDVFINAMAQLESGPGGGTAAAVKNLRGDSLVSQVMADELESALRMKEGKVDAALAHAASAASAEDGLNFEFGPPLPVIPAHEFYGQMLLRSGRTKEAAAQFRAALQRTPGRTHSLLGLARTGDREALDQLRKNWGRADAEVKDPILAEFPQ